MAKEGRPGLPRTAGCLLLALVLVAVAGVGGLLLLRGDKAGPIAGQQRCLGTAAGSTVAIDLDQAHYASIIVGVSVRRKLPPRAASIAMATVYQETGIRNLGYGDRDSVGLFQQRPSQGWGTTKQLRDPYYATGKFYDALVRVPGWQTLPINDVAQRVQRSGHPEAYRDHEADGRILASTLTGQSPAGFSCLDRSRTAGKPAALTTALRRTFGPLSVGMQDKTVTVRAASADQAWAYAHFAVANVKYYGVIGVTVADRAWATSQLSVPSWTGPATAAGGSVPVTIRLR